ncbi:hypothetical protein MMC10_007725 [Thelotrema lepadinum]|nr:hypothetical protein [Thelotrema lepadinum]
MLTFSDLKLPELSTEDVKAHTAIEVVIDAPLSKDDVETLLESLHKLANKARLSDLNLAISCECSMDIAKLVVDGLAPLRGLKNLALNLNHKPDAEFSKLAKSTVLSLARDYSRDPFPFERLPEETRHKILSFTNLVPKIDESTTPWDERNLRIQNGVLFRPYTQSCCKTCTRSLKHCACWKTRGAYSTTCTCFEYPSALFRVNRLLHDDSTQVCFSQNRFLLEGDTSADNLNFLFGLPDKALKAMRQLDVLLGEEQVEQFGFEASEEQQNFRTLIKLIALKCHLPNLHFSLDTGFLQEEYFQATQSGEDLTWLYGAYQRITDALMPLSSVDRFEMFFGEYCEEEDTYEKKVKGESYNAWARGKNHWSQRSELAPHSPVNQLNDKEEDACEKTARFKGYDAVARDGRKNWSPPSDEEKKAKLELYKTLCGGKLPWIEPSENDELAYDKKVKRESYDSLARGKDGWSQHSEVPLHSLPHRLSDDEELAYDNKVNRESYNARGPGDDHFHR